MPALSSMPGSADRTHFADEQARHRRAARRYAALCTLVVLLMCAAMSVLLAPVIIAIIGLAVDVVNLVIPMPNLLGVVWQHVDAVIDQLDNPGAIGRVATLAAWGAIPGIVMFAALWIGLQRLFARAGVNGLLQALPLRSPNPLDLEEKQLVNVIEEMSIAATVPAPKVMLIDAPGINCGALGTSIEDAVIIVSRGLLERLDRDATQGALAHLIASIGNGDMRIGHRMVTVMQMLSTISLLVNAPVNREARGLFVRFVRLGFGRASQADAQAVAAMLANPFHTKHSGGADDSTNKWIALVTFGASMVDLIFSKIAQIFFLGPVLGMIWRRRKHLADAMAVELTRQPDALANALVAARRQVRTIPGAEWAAHLFVFDPRGMAIAEETIEDTAKDAPAETITFSMLAERLRAGFGKPAPEGSAAAQRQAEHRERLVRVMRAARADTAGDATGLAAAGTARFMPTTRKRLERLRAMGATIEARHPLVLGQWKMWLLLSPLFALLAVLVAALFVLAAYVVMMLSMLVVVLPVGALHALLRWIGG